MLFYRQVGCVGGAAFRGCEGGEGHGVCRFFQEAGGGPCAWVWCWADMGWCGEEGMGRGLWPLGGLGVYYQGVASGRWVVVCQRGGGQVGEPVDPMCRGVEWSWGQRWWW